VVSKILIRDDCAVSEGDVIIQLNDVSRKSDIPCKFRRTGLSGVMTQSMSYHAMCCRPYLDTYHVQCHCLVRRLEQPLSREWVTYNQAIAVHLCRIHCHTVPLALILVLQRESVYCPHLQRLPGHSSLPVSG